MPITRKFFDWREPALPQVVHWLCTTRGRDGFVDLDDVLLVVPGRRAGRRFEELLLAQTNGRFAPPRIVTLGQLPEELYEPQKPFACDLTQRLAWAQALNDLPRSSVEVLLRNIPEPGDLDRWLALGTLLSRHHTELAADGLDFRHVAERGGELPGFDEQDRWTVLRAAQEKYLERLDQLGLWDQQTARLVAIERRECRTQRHILLLAAVDINRAPRQMLDQVAEDVTALIHAPQELADRFDEHGCLRPEAWADEQVDLTSDRIRVVDGPAEQAAEAAHAIAEYDGAYRADQITIGVADESLIPHLRRQLRECGLATRPVVERPLRQTPPAVLLAAVADYLAHDRASDFAALVRHADVAAWLEAQQVPSGWLSELDQYIAESLQPRLGDWLGPLHQSAKLRQAFAAVRRWLAPLIGPPRPLGEWSLPIADALVAIYAPVEFDETSEAQRVTLAACRHLQQALDVQARVPSSLAATFTAAEAIHLALESVTGAAIPPPTDPQAIPLLGWLELPLDDAPAAVITSFNEGFVPSSLNSDLFLPNRLRSRLGVLDNARRYARDVYALCAVLHSREAVTLVVGRRTAEGDPLKPSRLLFAAEPEVIARRVLEFYGAQHPGRSLPGGSPGARPPLPTSLTTSRSSPGFLVPRPLAAAAPIQALSVTAFRDYLACPYRFYLSRVLGLEAVDDVAEELSGLDFGNLLHHVLQDFGTSELITSSDAGTIREYLETQLQKQAVQRLGAARLPAVHLQIEQLRQRLRAFSQAQAENVELGWETHFIEVPDDNSGGVFDLGDGRLIRLNGRIDRIDYHPDRDCWRILDYKTEARGRSPDEIHRQKGEWVDLQLPLYRHMARPLGVVGRVELAFFLLPERSERTRLEIAAWTPVELEAADELARQTARRILDGVFWPPADRTTWKYDGWSAICQSTAFDREVIATGSGVAVASHRDAPAAGVSPTEVAP